MSRLTIEPQYIPADQLYNLKSGEEVVFTVNGGQTYQEMMAGKKFTATELAHDQRFVAAWRVAKVEAIQIMTGPIVRGSCTSLEEVQGYYDRVRVVPARHSITGNPDLGWTLIGVRKDFRLAIEETSED